MWKQMEGEGSRQAAPDGRSGSEEGSHTHCVVAVMGRIDFWLKDYYRTPKSWVQLHPLPLHEDFRPSGSCLLPAWGCQLTKNTDIFYACFALSSHLHKEQSWTRHWLYWGLSSNTEFWPRQGSYCPVQKIRGKKSPDTLFQPYPNILPSPCWSSTLLGCTGMRVSCILQSRELREYKHVLGRGEPQKKRQGRAKRGNASKLVENKAHEGSTSTYVSWQYSKLGVSKTLYLPKSLWLLTISESYF